MRLRIGWMNFDQCGLFYDNLFCSCFKRRVRGKLLSIPWAMRAMHRKEGATESPGGRLMNYTTPTEYN